MSMDHATGPARLQTVEEGDAVGEVAAIYDEIKRTYQVPFVPNMPKALGASAAALGIHWGISKTFFEKTTLPQALSTMIWYTIAAKSECSYCTAQQELSCRQLGIDDATLQALLDDLDSVSPQRIGAIVEFAYKAAKYPQTVTEEDYEALRRHGISDGEIVEIVQIAAIGVYLDTVADALKIEVESQVHEALADLRSA